MASFSALDGALPSIALRVLHSLVGSDLWSNVSTYCLHDRYLCFCVSLLSSSFICCSLGEVGSCERRSSLPFISSWISAGTGFMPRWRLPEGMWSDAAFSPHLHICQNITRSNLIMYFECALFATGNTINIFIYK